MSVTGWDGVTLTVELGLSSATGAYALWGVSLWDVGVWGPDVAFADVTRYVRGWSMDRQFSRAVQGWREGTATVVLDNRDGRFSPSNLAGPYVAGGVTQIRPMLPIRITTSYASTSYAVYRGYVRSWTDSWSGGAVGRGDAVTTLSCADEWAKLAKVDGIEVAPVGAGDRAGPRIHRILDAAGNTAARNVESGSSTMQATTLADNVLTEIDKVVEAEGGACWIEADGSITFEGRDALVNNLRSVNSQATFADDGSGYKYADASVEFDAELMVNYASYTPEGGTAQVASAPTSRSLNGEARDVKTGLICETDGQALVLAQWVVTQYQDPQERFVSVTVKPRRDPTNLWPQVLGRHIRDMITVVRNPPGGFEISRDCHIAGISHQVTAADWTTTFHLWDATVYAAFATSRWDVGRWDSALWSF